MPKGKTQRNLDLIDTAYTILETMQPASVRAVCYQLFMRGLIKNMSKGQTDRVSKQLVYAREQAIIPWDWIVDETRAVERAPTWETPEVFAQCVLQSYRKDWWLTQSVRVEVWSEKGTVRGTLAPVLTEYAVNFRVLHGFGSATVVHSVAQESLEDARPLLVYYVGDLDPSGLWMSERDLPGRVERYNGIIEMHRIALTWDDPQQHNLPHFEAVSKKNDPRYKWFSAHHGTRCWELDALSPLVLRERLRSTLQRCVNLDAWERCEKVEKAERYSLRKILQNWNAVKRGQASI
jgi:hypothetical protein